MSAFFMGTSNCRERPCVAQALRSTVNWLLVRRNAVGAASQNHRELNHGKTGTGLAPRLRTTVIQITAKPEKGDPFWGLKPLVGVWPNHGGFEALSRQFGADSWYFQFTVVSRLGHPGTAPATGQAHPHSPTQGFENSKD